MNNPITIKLQKGEVQVHDFGEMKSHSYINRDPMDDVVTLVEKNGMGVVIDPPSFFDNIQELTEYLEMTGVTVLDVILSYHMAGASFLPEARKWSTERAERYGQCGVGKGMADGFSKAFGKSFDHKPHAITNYLNRDSAVMSDIELWVSETPEAFDIEIPEINSVYIHMLGHDEHSIVPSREYADDFINKLHRYVDAGVNLIMSAHHTPETDKDALEKIKYLKKLISLAGTSKSAHEFKSKMNRAFPNHKGENYLDMTANFLFKS